MANKLHLSNTIKENVLESLSTVNDQSKIPACGNSQECETWAFEEMKRRLDADGNGHDADAAKRTKLPDFDDEVCNSAQRQIS